MKFDEMMFKVAADGSKTKAKPLEAVGQVVGNGTCNSFPLVPCLLK